MLQWVRRIGLVCDCVRYKTMEEDVKGENVQQGVTVILLSLSISVTNSGAKDVRIFRNRCHVKLLIGAFPPAPAPLLTVV